MPWETAELGSDWIMGPRFDLDLDAVAAWNAAAVVSLVESLELERLQVSGLGEAVRDRHMEWVHLPIRDRDVPDGAFEAAWQDTGERLRDRLRAGFSVLVHCMGGLGRAGTIVSRLLVEIGWDPEQAIRAVRKVRPGASPGDPSSASLVAAYTTLIALIWHTLHRFEIVVGRARRSTSPIPSASKAIPVGIEPQIVVESAMIAHKHPCCV